MCLLIPIFFLSQTMHITNELIHNPGVNEKLDEMGINFVPGETCIFCSCGCEFGEKDPPQLEGSPAM